VNFPDWFKLLGIAVVVVGLSLNMRDQYGVIKFQLPFVLTIWTLPVLLLWTLIRVFGW
jgi:hypothetical protein